MQNIDVRFGATANFAQVQAQIKALQSQVAAFNTELAAAGTANRKQGELVNAQKWRNASAALTQVSDAYRAAAASSGLLTASQLRSRPVVEQNTEALKKNKLAIGDVIGWNLKLKQSVKDIYRDQLRIQKMTVTSRGLDKWGREISDITVPTTIPKSLDSINMKLRFARTLAGDINTQMINLGKNVQWTGRQMMVGFTYPMVLLGAATAKMAYDVDKELTRISKVYDSTLGGEALMLDKATEKTKLRADSYALAERMARSYGAAATDVLKVEGDLAATGLSGQKLLMSTAETIRIATLGELEQETATNLTISLQNAFKDTIKTSDDLAEAFNFLNATENATSLGIQDIAEALPRAGSAMAAVGVDVKQATILMASMKEAGVEAAQGANALKSATGTILAPSPAADEFIKQISDGKVQVTELAEASGGNLYNALEILSKQMRGLSDVAKQQILVKLFGKYQFNRVSAMLYNLDDALNGVSNQTARAIKTASMTGPELAALAEAEIREKMNSISGQFDAAWETLKIKAAQMGEAFLPVVTKTLKIITKVVEAVMSLVKIMPDWMQTVSGIGLAALALMGPLIMISGIFLQMAGWGLKLIGLGTKFKIVNRAQMAAQIQAEKTAKAYTDEAASVALLTAELNALAAAQGYSTGVGQVALVSGVGGSTGTADRSRDAIPLPAGYSYKDDAKGRRTYIDPSGSRVKGDNIESVRKWRREQEIIKRSTEDATKNIKKAALASDDAADAATRTRRGWDGTRVASGLMTATIIGSMIPGVDKFANHLMTASMAIMGIATAKDLLASRQEKKLAAATDAAKKNTLKTAAGTGLIAAGWAKVKTTLGRSIAMLTKFAKGFGPIGWGITAIVAASTFIWKKSQESSKQQDALNKSAQAWAKSLGGVAREYKTIAQITSSEDSKGISSREIADKLASSEDEDTKNIVNLFKEMKGDASEIDMRAMTEYIKMIEKTNLSAADAKVGLEAMFLAAGYSAQFAESEAEKYFDLLGDKITNAEWGTMWRKQLNEMFSAGGDWDNRIDGMIKELSDNMASAANGFKRGGHFDTFANAFESEFSTALDNAIDSGTEDVLNKAGLTDPDKIRDALGWDWEAVLRARPEETKKIADSLGLNMNLTEDVELINDLARAMHDLSRQEDIGKLLDSEKEMAKVLAEQYGIELDQYTLDALRLRLQEDRYALTKKEAMARYRERVASQTEVWGADHGFGIPNVSAITKALDGDLRTRREITREQKLQILNEERVLSGLSETTRLSDRFQENTEGTAEALKKSGKEATELARAGNKVWQAFRKTGWRDELRTIMQNNVSAAADEASNTLQDQQEREQEALDALHEREEQSLENRQEYWDNYYENALEKSEAFYEKTIKRVEKHYDRRVKAINNVVKAEEKANDTRQRIFDAEQTRLQRMAANQNANIDFNMALNSGQLDEAAKMLNDAEARTAANQMDDEQKRADYELEVRRASLEKQIEILEDQRDRRVKALENARKAKEKEIEMARDAKDKVLEIARERARKENDIEKKSLDSRHKMQSRHYDMALAELNSFIPRSQKQLVDHISKLNAKYAHFGVKLKTNSSSWAEFIGKQHNRELAQAANRLKSDVDWAGAGSDAAQGMLAGMAGALGFKNVGQLRKWLGIEAQGPQKNSIGEPMGQYKAGKYTIGAQTTFSSKHSGGEIGSPGKRTGYAGAFSPHSETLINAQKGEYMVKKAAVNKYGIDFMDRINDGTYGVGGPTGAQRAGGMGMVGAMAPLLLRTMMQSMNQKLSEKSERVASAQGLPGALYGAAKAGQYGGTAFDPDQLANAAIIASVGSEMGMSQRDIVIGLMTAMQESMLRNIDYGDRDSLGLFQQRPSMGWGTPAQVTNPHYAARKFFEGLKGVENRNELPLTYAAQAVQRSAFPTAYAKWEDEAREILANMGTAPGAGFVQGSGKRSRPVRGGALTQGLHYNNAVDIGIASGSPLYAVADGRVTRSYDITGHEPRARHGGLGYRSYGRVIEIDHGGFKTLNAHLSRRSVSAGQRVLGGARIGYTGDTGNSSGPHLHFEAHGASPYAFLRKGGELKWDNTPAVLHKGETVLTAPLTKQFKDNVANGGGNEYNVTIDLRGAYVREEVDIKSAVKEAVHEMENKVGRKRKVE